MKESLELQRHILGSVDLVDLVDTLESEQERKDYCAAIFAVYPRIEKDLKRFMHTQLLFSSMQAETWEQTLFGRGTFNGLSLVLEHWRKAQAEHIESVTPEPFDKTMPLSEV